MAKQLAARHALVRVPMTRRRPTEAGFTLIEIMIVMALIVTLAGVGNCSSIARNQSLRELPWKRSASGKYSGR